MKLEQGIFEGLAGLRLAMRRFLAFSEGALADAQVTSNQYQALLIIKTSAGEGVRVRELADQMLMQPHGAVQLVDRLSAAGLAERIPSDRDKRSVLVRLTTKGSSVLDALAAHHLRNLLIHEPLLVESIAKLRQLSHSAGDDAP